MRGSVEASVAIFTCGVSHGRISCGDSFVLAIIGKRFADAGLADLLIESGVLGPSTVCSVLSGKHYNRGVRAHKAAMEALFRTLWRKFEVWLN